MYRSSLLSTAPPARARHHPQIGRASAAPAASAPLPQLPSRLPVREACAAPGARAALPWCSPPAVGGFAVEPSWLAYAWRLDDGPPLLCDPAVQRLRRQLGVGGRWAWQDEPEAEPAEPAEEVADAAAEAPLEHRRPVRRAAGSALEPRGRLPAGYLPSLRGRGRRRSGGQRSCRGRALAGPTELSAEDWLHSALPEELRVSAPGRCTGCDPEECSLPVRFEPVKHSKPHSRPGHRPALDCADKSLLPAATSLYLQGCSPGRRLTAMQEARCGELVQAAKAAVAGALAALDQRQQQQHGRPVAAAAAGSATVGEGQLAAGQQAADPCIAELRSALQRGAAASLLLQRCNQGLVGLVHRRVARGRQLSPALCQVRACRSGPGMLYLCRLTPWREQAPCLASSSSTSAGPGGRYDPAVVMQCIWEASGPGPLQELTLAGMDALSRAAASYAPARDTRFSTYACAAIQNAMLGALACCERGPGGSWQQPLVHVPHHARGLAARVQRAAHQAQRQRAVTAAAGASQQQRGTAQGSQQLSVAAAAEQRHKDGERTRRLQGGQPSQPALSGLQQLSEAARLTARQTELGLAAARRQWVASPDSQVPAGSVECGLARRPARQTARFIDLHEEVRVWGVRPLQVGRPLHPPAPLLGSCSFAQALGSRCLLAL